MKKRSGIVEDTVEFWSELSELSDQNYWKCIEKHLTEDHHSRAGVISIQPRTCDTNINFCKRQPFSFSDNCEPMCNLVKNCEMHDNFLCPDENKKALMDTCCSLWDDKFKCDYPLNHQNTTVAPSLQQANHDTVTDPKDNLLVYLLPALLVSLAVVIILGILLILKRIKKTKSKYKNPEEPRTQSTVSGEYEEYGSDYQSTQSGTEINTNMNYVNNTPF